jgi:hypothetical protein
MNDEIKKTVIQRIGVKKERRYNAIPRWFGPPLKAFSL